MLNRYRQDSMVISRDEANSTSQDFRISFIKKSEQQIVSHNQFYTLIHCLMIMLSELEAGTFSLRDCLGITRPPSFKEFVTFLEAMEVYGCGYQQDVDNKLYSKRQHKTHKDDMLT